MGETKFQPREFPRSGSKAIEVEEREREKEEEEQKSVITMANTCCLNQNQCLMVCHSYIFKFHAQNGLEASIFQVSRCLDVNLSVI